jgi:osmoprotectant transport system ATP-binding protein
MIELRGVSKSYGSQEALQSTDLIIPTGRTTVLIGPSGCGKSTLLRLMIGLLEPDAGEVLFEGTRVVPANVESVCRRMGYVVQDGGLFPHLSAEQNIRLMPRYLGWPADRTRARLKELSRLTQFPEDGLGRYPAQISGGQRQRVSLMRALMLDPDVLLLDEPLGALDPMIRSELQTDLRGIFQSLRKTVVLVTHDLGEASYLGDNIVLLQSGRIVQQGRFEELVRSPAEAFVTQFIRAQRSLVESLGEKQ